MTNPFETIDKRLGNIEELLLSIKHPDSLQRLPKSQESKQYAYGLPGLASIANCSITTAWKLKNSGQIPFSQSGRKLIFEVEAVLEALKFKVEKTK